MTKTELNNLYELLCTSNAELAFMIAKGKGLSESDLIKLIWCKFSFRGTERVSLHFNHLCIYNIGTFAKSWWMGGPGFRNQSTRDDIINSLIYRLKTNQ